MDGMTEAPGTFPPHDENVPRCSSCRLPLDEGEVGWPDGEGGVWCQGCQWAIESAAAADEGMDLSGEGGGG